MTRSVHDEKKKKRHFYKKSLGVGELFNLVGSSKPEYDMCYLRAGEVRATTAGKLISGSSALTSPGTFGVNEDI